MMHCKQMKPNSLANNTQQKGQQIEITLNKVQQINIDKGTTDPGVECFDHQFWFGRFSSVCLVGLSLIWFGKFGLAGLVW